MQNLVTFNFQNNQIRTQAVNDEPYFCLRDVCQALNLKNSKDRDFDKGVETFYLPTQSGNQNITFINEPNLYRLIFRSNKPQAQAFADWVYSEVLPSIRKTGGYGVAVSKKEIPTLPTPDADLKDWCAEALALMIENRVRIAIEAERERFKKLIEKAI